MAFSDWAVLDRAGLAAGDRLKGPLVVESADTTILVPPGCTAEIDNAGSLILQVTGAEP